MGEPLRESSPLCQHGSMRFIVKTIVVALALWLTTFIVSGVTVVPYNPLPDA